MEFLHDRFPFVKSSHSQQTFDRKAAKHSESVDNIEIDNKDEFYHADGHKSNGLHDAFDDHLSMQLDMMGSYALS